MSDEQCARLEEQIKTLFANGERREQAIHDLRQDIKEIKETLANRLPNWATFALATLTAVVGGLIGLIIK